MFSDSMVRLLGALGEFYQYIKFLHEARFAQKTLDVYMALASRLCLKQAGCLCYPTSSHSAG